MAEGQYSDSSRPETTIVQSFATDLDSMFGLGSGSVPDSSDAGVGQLEQTVEEKKQAVTEAARNLEALEAKVREMEAKLMQASGHTSPPQQANASMPRSNPDEQIISSATTGSDLPTETPTQPANQPADRPADRLATGARPQNTRGETQALMAGMPGAMPITPREYGGSQDYVMVDRSGRSGQSVG